MARKPAQKPVAAAAADERPITVVYIHGIGSKPPPDVLKRQWDQALFGADMGARTRMAYWADIRHPASETKTLAVGIPEAYRPLSDAELVDESRRLAPYGKDAEAFAQALAKRLLQKPASRAKAKGVEAKVLPGLIRGPVTEWLTKTFIQDTAAYFYDREQRAAMQERLRRLLIPEGGPYLVVAHSQGTIIAYDVLRALEKEGVPVPLLVTLGSPLGIQEVQDHITRPLAIPKNVTDWKNFADLLDPVSLDKKLENDFAPKGRIEDQLVENRESFRFAAGFDPHSSTGYLETPEVRAAARDRVPATAAGPVASFVVARDVAADMDRSFQRLPVLIELSADLEGGTLSQRRDALVEELTQLTGKAKEAAIDPLARYVAACLTQEEIVRLGARHQNLNITRIWKNSRKRALLDQSGQTVQAYTAQLGYGATGRDIAWAVLDTGVRADHPHFATHGSVKAQFDCTGVGKPVKGKALDGNGHGTHVAGIIGGTGQAPNDRYKGMAPEVGLYIYKVLDD
jgi:hypothetical protein